VWGNTALHIACWNRASLQTITYLLKAGGSSLQEVDDRRMTPLHRACGPGPKKGNGSRREGPTSISIIWLLVEHYPRAVLECDDKGRTPLMLAIEHHCATVQVKNLLSSVETLLRRDHDKKEEEREENILKCIGEEQGQSGLRIATSIRPDLVHRLLKDERLLPMILEKVGGRRGGSLNAIYAIFREMPTK